MAAKTGDIKFTADSVDYNYMLAVDADGNKRWSIQQLYMQPPSIIKNKIDMVIKAAPNMREPDDDIISTRTIATVMAELRILVDETDPTEITLDGYDGQTYNVIFDTSATSISAVFDETGRIVEYNISISVWDLYQPS